MNSHSEALTSYNLPTFPLECLSGMEKNMGRLVIGKGIQGVEPYSSLYLLLPSSPENSCPPKHYLEGLGDLVSILAKTLQFLEAI